MSHQKVYTARQFADAIGVHIRTVQRWDQHDLFKARRTPTNKRFYTQEDFDRYLEEGVRKSKELAAGN